MVICGVFGVMIGEVKVVLFSVIESVIEDVNIDLRIDFFMVNV